MEGGKESIYRDSGMRMACVERWLSCPRVLGSALNLLMLVCCGEQTLMIAQKEPCNCPHSSKDFCKEALGPSYWLADYLNNSPQGIGNSPKNPLLGKGKDEAWCLLEKLASKDEIPHSSNNLPGHLAGETAVNKIMTSQ